MIREALDAALAFSLTGENVHNIIEKKNEILRGGDDIHAIVVINTMHVGECNIRDENVTYFNAILHSIKV